MPRPRKRVLELSGGVGSLPQAPWWNADRRRVPLDARRAREGTEVTEQRLSAFRFPFCFCPRVVVTAADPTTSAV